MIKHEATATLPVAASEVNLGQWLFTLTDEDYRATARGHHAAGIHRHHDGRQGMVNVEAIGGSLIIQHYHAAQAGPAFVEMVSPESRGYLMHLMPVPLSVRWVMSVSPTAAGTSTLTCRVEVGFPMLVQLAGAFIGTSRAIRKHVEEETAGFAADILRKVRHPNANAVQPQNAA